MQLSAQFGATPLALSEPKRRDTAQVFTAGDQRSLPQVYATTTVLGTAAGLAMTGIAALLTRGAIKGSPRALFSGAALGAAVLGAASVFTDHRFGTQLTNETWGKRHQYAWALTQLRTPGVIAETRAGFAAAEQMQVQRWGTKRHLDDGVDAVRHSFASATIAARVMIIQGQPAGAAIRIVHDVGVAHERDAAFNPTPFSRPMDEHNNVIGARIGVDLAARLERVPTEHEILAEIAKAIARGELRVVDPDAPNGLRPTRPKDVKNWEF